MVVRVIHAARSASGVPRHKASLASRWSRVRQAVLAAPVVGLVVRAMCNYVLHQSGNQAGSVAF